MDLFSVPQPWSYRKERKISGQGRGVGAVEIEAGRDCFFPIQVRPLQFSPKQIHSVVKFTSYPLLEIQTLDESHFVFFISQEFQTLELLTLPYIIQLDLQ